MTVLATITDDVGFETCYVSLKTLVAIDGAIVGTPAIASSNPSAISVSDPALNTIEAIYNGTTHAIGELFTFKASTAAGNSGSHTQVEVTVETAKRIRSACYRIEKEVC